MKKLVILIVLVAAGVFGWKHFNQGGDDPLADLRARLESAEKTYQQAGRAAGMSGIDTSSDAEAARQEISRVEAALRDMKRSATSDEDKRRIDKLLTRAADIKRRMG